MTRKAPSPELVRDIRDRLVSSWVEGLTAEARSLISAHDVAALATQIAWAIENEDFAEAPFLAVAQQLEAIAGTPIVSQESIGAAREYQKQLALMSTTSKGFAQILVDDLAPAMSQTAAVASGASIEMLKFAKSVQDSEDQLFEAHPAFAAFIKEFNSTAIFGSAGANFLELANTIGVATGAFDSLAAEGRAGAIVAEAQARSAKAVDEAHKKAADEGLEKYESKLKDVERASDKAAKAEKEHAKEVAEAEQELLASRGASWLQYAQDQKAATEAQVQQQLDALALWDAAVAQVQQDTIEAANAFQDLQKQGTEEMKAVIESFTAEAFAFADQLAAQAQAHHEEEIARLDELTLKRQENLKNALKAGNKERAEEIRGRIAADKVARDLEVKAAKRAYAVQQGIALTQIVISTAQATMALLASPAISALGPGAPAAAAALAIGTGVLQAAAVAAAPPPKFHSGRAAKQPGEQSATVLDTESVLTGRATQRLGGAKAVNALNAGASIGGGMPTVYLGIDGRQADRLVTTAMRSGKGTALALKERRDPLGAGHYGRRR